MEDDEGPTERPLHSRAPAGIGADARARLRAIEQAPLFRGASPEEKVALARRSRDSRLGRGQAFVREGAPALECLLLCSGRVKLSQLSASGSEFITRLVVPGEQFGGLGLAQGSLHASTAEALEPSHALVWDRRCVEEVIERSGEMQRNALRILAQRLRSSEQSCHELATEKVPQRLSRTLYRLVGQIGRPAETGVLVSLTREELAQMTGTTTFTVSRIVAYWESKGLIRSRREGVIVRNLGALATIGEGETDVPVDGVRLG